MQTFHGIAELSAAVGTHLGHSSWHEITQGQVDDFATATGDHQWIHTDPQRAARGPFGAPIAHGYLTLSLVPLLVGQVYEVQDVAMQVNYGAERLRFPAPVPVGSRVRAGVELLELIEKPAGHQLTSRVTVEIEGAAKPACVVDTVTVLA